MDRSSTSGAGGEFGASRMESQSTGDATEQGRSRVEEAKATVKEELRGARDDAQRRAADTVNRQKHQVADRLDSIVHALHAAQQSLREDKQSQLSLYVSDLTSQVERSTGYLRNNDFSGMMRDMERLARNNTGLFLGSTLVAGMAMGRFLRASEPEEPQGELAAGYGTSGYIAGSDGATGFDTTGRTGLAGGTTGRAYSDQDARAFGSADLDVSASPRREGEIGFASTGETERREFRAGELGTGEPGGATGTRGSIGAPGEGGLTGGSERDRTRREEP